MPRRLVIANIVFGTTVAVLVLTARTPHAQETPRPAFRVSTDLVVVDLLATGRSQQSVSDLQPGDLQVFEDGTPQKIEFVRLVRHGGATTSPTSGATASGWAARSGSAATSRCG